MGTADGGSAGVRASTPTRALFGITAFTASALLFVVEPMVARTLLPALGGSASVWNSAMLTFQVLLLAGYVVAHLGARRLPRRWFGAVVVVLGVAAAFALPVGLRAGWQPPRSVPALWTVWAVAAAVAAPFVALSCVSPALQRWYGSVAPGDDPYVLYAAGNVGSFVGLLAYPLAIERWLGVHEQRVWWSRGYVGFLVLLAGCAVVARIAGGGPGGPDVAEPVDRSAPRRDLLRWGAMAFGPSLLLLGVTRHVSTDIAAIPLLWVVPLGLYLLTFVVAFSGGGRTVIGACARFAPVLAGVAVVSLAASLPGVIGVGLHVLTSVVLALAVHGRLAAERPPLDHLTSYYLALSAGGAVGGLVGGLVAPVVFTGIYEYPLGILASVVWLTPQAALGPRARRVAGLLVVAFLVAALVVQLTGEHSIHPPRLLQVLLGLALLAGLAACVRGRQFAACLGAVALVAVAVPSSSTVYQARTYYGVSRVLEAADGTRYLVSGTTVHGAERPGRPDLPLTYYSAGSPLADVVERTGGAGPRSIGVIGLGSGSIAAYTRPGDRLTFYEIDPAIIHIATDPHLFDFVARARGRVRIVEGDGRRSLAAVAPASHDLLIVDAFSSDSIPLHLVTREALATYRRAVGPHGVIAFHVSNHFFDLVPVVARLGRDAGLQSLTRLGIGTVPGSSTSVVVVLGPPDALAALGRTPGWVRPTPAGSVWTDDRADVLGSLHLS